MNIIETKNFEDMGDFKENKNGMLGKFSSIIKRIVDCCKE